VHPLIPSVLVIPLVLLLAACGGDRRASAPATTRPPAVASTPSSSARSDWAQAPGAGAKAVSNVGTATSEGHGRTVTRVLVADTTSDATRRVRHVEGAWALPVPVAHGATEGLSWDGSVAVMQSTNATSRFVALPLAGDGEPRIVDLRRHGKFGYDALSSRGTKLYLTQYADASGAPVARIRLYDLATEELDPNPVIDKREGDESMTGTPVERIWSVDGRIAYTLYEGAEHPFVHMLQTDSAISFCIDLPAHGDPAAPGGWTLRLDGAGATLTAESDRLGASFLIGLDGMPKVEGVAALPADATAP
jgi:hypothetical protein